MSDHLPKRHEALGIFEIFETALPCYATISLVQGKRLSPAECSAGALLRPSDTLPRSHDRPFKQRIPH